MFRAYITTRFAKYRQTSSLVYTNVCFGSVHVGGLSPAGSFDADMVRSPFLSCMTLPLLAKVSSRSGSRSSVAKASRSPVAVRTLSSITPMGGHRKPHRMRVRESDSVMRNVVMAHHLEGYRRVESGSGEEGTPLPTSFYPRLTSPSPSLPPSPSPGTWLVPPSSEGLSEGSSTAPLSSEFTCFTILP